MHNEQITNSLPSAKISRQSHFDRLEEYGNIDSSESCTERIRDCDKEAGATRLTDTTLQSEKSSDLRRVSEDVGKVQVDDTEDRIVFAKSRVSNDDSDDRFLPISNKDFSSGFVEWHRRVSAGLRVSVVATCTRYATHCLTRVLKTMLSLTIICEIDQQFVPTIRAHDVPRSTQTEGCSSPRSERRCLDPPYLLDPFQSTQRHPFVPSC